MWSPRATARCDWYAFWHVKRGGGAALPVATRRNMLIARCISALTGGPLIREDIRPALTLSESGSSIAPTTHPQSPTPPTHPHARIYLSRLHLKASPKPAKSYHNLFQWKQELLVVSWVWKIWHRYHFINVNTVFLMFSALTYHCPIKLLWLTCWKTIAYLHLINKTRSNTSKYFYLPEECPKITIILALKWSPHTKLSCFLAVRCFNFFHQLVTKLVCLLFLCWAGGIQWVLRSLFAGNGSVWVYLCC